MDLDQTAELPAGSPAQPSRKRKAPSSGSRGVASLTPEALRKKRENDREAQRAIRTRTRQTIESLEQKIQELTAQQPYQELQTVIREKEAIQAENTEIRRRLASILALIQPIVGAQGLTGSEDDQSEAQILTWTDLASAAHHNAQTVVAESNNIFQQPDSYVNGGQRSYGPPPLSQGESAYPPFTDTGSGPPPPWHASKDALGQRRDNLRRGLELTENGERLNFNFLLENIASQRPSAPAPALHQQQSSPSRPVPYYNFTSSPTEDQRPWNTLPRSCEPTCPLDSILLNLHQKGRRDGSADGESSPASQHIPNQPSIMSLLNPSHSSIDALSMTMADITTRFPHINTVPNRVATVWAMFVTARWVMYPTQENYERVPEWMRPRSSQLLVPHPAWMDYIPFPLMRDKLIENHKAYHFEDWFIPFTIGLSVNWPYPPMDCLLSTSENEDPVINPVFESHINKLENWSIAPDLIETYPQLKGTAIVRAQEGTREMGETR